jgi:hypothetical protein
MTRRSIPHGHRVRFSAIAVVALLIPSACGGGSTVPTTTVPLAVIVSPEHVNGVLPGSELLLLVGRTDGGNARATVTAQAPGATVSVEPSTISADDVAEVTVIPNATNEETELTVTITVTADSSTETVTRVVTVVPWEDDRDQQAAEILGLFTPWLAANRPELGLTPAAVFDGTFVAPHLLIVSHYAFLGDDWEIGVSWHVMVAPDDFAEIYLRPRSELRPTHAFRISSWQTAVATGVYEVTEVGPPTEVTR